MSNRNLVLNTDFTHHIATSSLANVMCVKLSNSENNVRSWYHNSLNNTKQA